MMQSRQVFSARSGWRNILPLEGLLVVVLSWVAPRETFAQPVIGSPATDTSAPSGPGGLLASAGAVAGGGGALGSVSTSADPAPIQWGPLGVRPHLAYQYTYGDGIQSRPGHQVKSAVSEISPGLFFKVGDTFTVDYTATQTLYSERDLTDNLSHAANLAAGRAVGSWMLGFSQSYGLSSTPMVETGSQTKQETAATGLSAGWELSRKISLSLAVSRSAQYAGPLGTTIEWATNDSLNYALSSRLGLGFSFGAGYSDIRPGPNSTFRSLGGSANWSISDKLDASIDLGRQSRASRSSASASTTTPTYTCSLGYKPFKYTTLSVSGTRSSTISLFQHQIQDSESWRVGLQQRLLGKFMFNCSVGHNSGSYRPSVAVPTPSRADSGKSLSAGIGATILKRGNIGFSFQRTINGSSLSGFGFASNQIGVQLGYKF